MDKLISHEAPKFGKRAFKLICTDGHTETFILHHINGNLKSHEVEENITDVGWVLSNIAQSDPKIKASYRTIVEGNSDLNRQEELIKFVELTKQNEDYQKILTILKKHLPLQITAFRGQDHNDYPERGIENLSVSKDVAIDFKKGKHGIIKEIPISRGDIVALGEPQEAEIIVDCRIKTPLEK